MKTYQVLLTCLVIFCGLQQHVWAAPSQNENILPSTQELDGYSQLRLKLAEMMKTPGVTVDSNSIRQLLYKYHPIHKRQTSNLHQIVRNMAWVMYDCTFKYATKKINDYMDWIEVSCTMYECVCR